MAITEVIDRTDIESETTDVAMRVVALIEERMASATYEVVTVKMDPAVKNARKCKPPGPGWEPFACHPESGDIVWRRRIS